MLSEKYWLVACMHADLSLRAWLAAGAVMVIVMIFMAVTSSGASEMLAVSSLFTFDIYRRYINPKVTQGSCCDTGLLLATLIQQLAPSSSQP